jgi:hypothetical protein
MSMRLNRPIVRKENKVHRPSHWWTPAVHDLLRYLQSVGVENSPRVHSFDDEGREILDHIDGGKAGWEKIISNDGLKRFAKLLRQYHDAVKDYKPPKELEWATGTKGLQSDEIICHGGFGPLAGRRTPCGGDI